MKKPRFRIENNGEPLPDTCIRAVGPDECGQWQDGYNGHHEASSDLLGIMARHDLKHHDLTTRERREAQDLYEYLNDL
jgi:hypothetical protein